MHRIITEPIIPAEYQGSPRLFALAFGSPRLFALAINVYKYLRHRKK